MTVSAPPWAALLAAVAAPYLDRLSDHSDFRAWHVDVEFEPWQPAAGAAVTRQETYGWKPQVVPSDPRLGGGVGRSIGEVEVACRLRAAGFGAAAWTDAFGSAPEWWSRWIRRPRARRPRRPEAWLGPACPDWGAAARRCYASRCRGPGEGRAADRDWQHLHEARVGDVAGVVRRVAVVALPHNHRKPPIVQWGA